MARESERARAIEPGERDESVDLGALLVALVLVPHSYPRNRFFQLYKDPAAARVRRRAALIRSVVADLIDEARHVTLTQEDGEPACLRYHLPEPGVWRSTLLDRDELALVALAVARVSPSTPLCLTAVDDGAVERARARLDRLWVE